MTSAEEDDDLRAPVGESPSDNRDSNLPAWWVCGVVGLLLMVFGVLSSTAATGKSATVDETLHLVGGMTQRYLHDYRIDPEDPPLLGWWASLPHSARAMPLDPSLASFQNAASDIQQEWHFAVSSLYGGTCNFIHVMNASRFMFLILGIALGALIARWAYELAGGWASIWATAFYCLDPSFLGHASLVKNDVGASLLMFATSYTLWRFGRHGRWFWIVGSALLCGVAVSLKFSGLLLVALVPFILLIRAVLPHPWPVNKSTIQSVVGKLCVAAVGSAIVTLVVPTVIWTAYGFRFKGTFDAAKLPDIEDVATVCASVEIRVQILQKLLPRMDSNEIWTTAQRNLRLGDLPLSVQLDVFLSKHHLLPESWLYGFLYTYATSRIRKGYLLGGTSMLGWWYYFPLAMLFKTPVSTLTAFVVAPIAYLGLRLIPGPKRACDSNGRLWTIIAVALPPVVYFATALTTNLNLGIRHILPVYPFLFAGVGVGLATAARRWPISTRLVSSLLVLGLAVETLHAYPNYIAFFNCPSGGARGGLELLADSNLDWGQDLPALAAWQSKHADKKLYLCYFGTASPSAYGIHAVNLPGGWEYGPSEDLSPEPGVIAISATHVQGVRWEAPQIAEYLSVLDPETAHRIDMSIDLTDPNRTTADALRHIKPIEVLNGTIYLYDWPRTH